MEFPNVSCNTHNVCIQASCDKFLLFCDKCPKTWITVCLTSKRKERCVHVLHIIHIRYHECIRQFVLSPTVPTSGSYITTTNEGSSIRRNSQCNVLYYKTWNVFIVKSFEVILRASNKITKLTRASINGSRKPIRLVSVAIPRPMVTQIRWPTRKNPASEFALVLSVIKLYAA